MRVEKEENGKIGWKLITKLLNVMIGSLEVVLGKEDPWKVKVRSLSCVQLCDPLDCSPPGSSVHGIFQARVLEWGAISFSRRSSQPRGWTQVSRIVGRCFRIYSRILTEMFCKLYKNGVGGSNLKLQRQVREVWNYSGKQLREYKSGQWQQAKKGGNWCWEKPGILLGVREKTEGRKSEA